MLESDVTHHLGVVPEHNENLCRLHPGLVFSPSNHVSQKPHSLWRSTNVSFMFAMTMARYIDWSDMIKFSDVHPGLYRGCQPTPLARVPCHGQFIVHVVFDRLAKCQRSGEWCTGRWNRLRYHYYARCDVFLLDAK